MSPIPWENKLDPNIKFLRLTGLLREKKRALLTICFEKYTQYGWDRLCYDLLRSAFFLGHLLLNTPHLKSHIGAKTGENDVPTGLFLQETVQNVSPKQRKYMILCSILHLRKVRGFVCFFLHNYNEIHFRTELNVENIKMLQRSETAIELCRLSAGDNWHRRLVYSFSTLRVSRMIFFSNTEHSELPKCK